MHSYEIMLANGDRVYYKTDMSFDDFKKMIAENDFIEIEREPWVNIPHGWSSRPPKASYMTKSIVYVNWDKKWEESIREYDEKLNNQKSIKSEILAYIPNWKIKIKYHWYFYNFWDEDNFYNSLYKDEFLEKLLAHCKKYNCKRKTGSKKG